jgi:glycosyltransferase involved in cell wall biosynthesis
LLEDSLGAWLKVRELNRQARFQVIQCADFGGLGFWGLSRFRRAPLLLRGHGILDMRLPLAQRPGASFQHALERTCAQRASFVMAGSKALAQSYVSELKAPAERVGSLPSPFDVSGLTRYASIDKPRRENITVLYVGRFEQRKGCDLLFVALREVHRQLPAVHAVMMGAVTPELEAPLEAFLAENAGWASYLGSLPQAEVFQQMSQADILVLPSRSDALPRALIEALSLGVPQVATRVGGIPEIVEDGVTGLLVESEHTDALAAAILRLCRSPEMRAEMARASRERAMQKFEVDRVMTQYDRVLRALAEGESPRQALSQAV